MAAHPLLEAENLDEILDKAKAAAEAYCREPDPFPESVAERRQLLEAMDRDYKRWEGALVQTLLAISLAEKSFCANPFGGGNTPPPLDLDSLRSLEFAPYHRYFNPDEVRLFVFAWYAIWELSKRTHSVPSSVLEYRWNAALEHFRIYSHDLRRVPKVHRPLARAFNALPENQQKVYWSRLRVATFTLDGIGQLRDVLKILRDMFRATDTLRERLVATLPLSPQAAAPATEEPAVARLDGPHPPNVFRYGDSECIVDRPKVWLLLSHLWSCPRRTAQFSDLAEPVWRDREMDVDDNAVGSVRRDANRFFRTNRFPFKVAIQNGYCSLTSG